jgi:glutamate racemase
MHILITDSGVGGLSVCAYAERFLRKHGIVEAANLTYVNASPENDFGYNSMGSRSEKLENFNRFLNIISETYSPDSIYIACNTLSVLFSDTQFSKTERIPVQGIVETGVNRLFRDLGRSPRSAVAIFGTIISQACPSLADTISEDLRGSSAKKKIEKYVDAAIEKSNEETTDYLTYLACTHYGYRREYFSTAFEERGIKAQVLNPNEFVIEDLFGKYEKKLDDTMGKNDASVEFITRYKIPDTALETIASFLDDVSPKTVEAFTNYTHAPDLF